MTAALALWRRFLAAWDRQLDEARELPVEHARTAAAVDTVLRTATPGPSELFFGRGVSQPLCDALGIERADDVDLNCECVWCTDFDSTFDDLPGMEYRLWPVADDERTRYAPEALSPHLLAEDPS